MPEIATSQNEQRRHYRVDMQVHMKYYALEADETFHSLSQDKVEQVLFSGQSSQHYQLKKAAQQLESQRQSLHTILIREEPILADYLNLLNQKIDLVIGSFADNERSDMTAINLSVSGMAFVSDDIIPFEQLLKLKIEFPQSHEVLILNAKVIGQRDNHQHNQGEGYLIAVEYLNVNQEQDLILTREILAAQQHL